MDSTNYHQLFSGILPKPVWELCTETLLDPENAHLLNPGGILFSTNPCMNLGSLETPPRVSRPCTDMSRTRALWHPGDTHSTFLFDRLPPPRSTQTLCGARSSGGALTIPSTYFECLFLVFFAVPETATWVQMSTPSAHTEY